ncbi:TIGR02186 family protein [Maricaulis parjimensis]|uniref:TIGR02186 family protein n=1 Tax=Maricaulis parjimensis TaxID=144023 RepID=UPI00193A5E36|nr:TIGR02186 family protein [Maricaulis parjimensis]
MISAILLAMALQGQQPLIQTEAPSIVAALTHETVEIREDFVGQELVLYGATRGLTIQDEIVVVLRGPEYDLRVMRKERNFGVWVNSDPVVFADVPSYYAIATSLPLEDIASDAELAAGRIGLPSLFARQPVSNGQITLSQETVLPYLQAIARAGERQNLYAEAQRGVEVLDGGLFRATISLPPLTPVGDYVADVYLFREGRVIASRSAALRVEKAGLERFIYDFAQTLPWLYGLFCVLLAVLAGYIADAIFNRR